MTEEKNETIKAVIEYLQDNRCQKINSVIEGYTDPLSIKAPDSKIKVKPDITAKNDDTTLVLDVFDHHMEIDQFKDRWKTLSNFCQDSDKQFYLVAMNFVHHTVLNFTNENEIRAEILPVGLDN